MIHHFKVTPNHLERPADLTEGPERIAFNDVEKHDGRRFDCPDPDCQKRELFELRRDMLKVPTEVAIELTIGDTVIDVSTCIRKKSDLSRLVAAIRELVAQPEAILPAVLRDDPESTGH